MNDISIDDLHRHRLAPMHARPEAPLLDRRDRFLIEAEDVVERLDDVDVADRAVRHHDRLHRDHALDPGAHRLAGVVRLDLSDDDRRRDAVALAIDAPAGTPAGARTQSPEPVPGPDARTGARAPAAACARALRDGRRGDRVVGARQLDDGGHAGMLISREGLWGFAAWEARKTWAWAGTISAFRRRLRHLVAAATTAAARARASRSTRRWGDRSSVSRAP